MFYIMFNIYIFILLKEPLVISPEPRLLLIKIKKKHGLLSITFDPASIGLVPNLFVFGIA